VNIEILDLTTAVQPQKQVPIHLLACLQRTKNKYDEFSFYESANFGPEKMHVSSVKRVARFVAAGNLDLIIVNDNLVFLGRWNDGVL
jgi:hypothetical protein